MSEAALLDNFLLVGAILFVLGIIGFLNRRNMIVMFISAEMMLQGVSLSLVAWGRFHNNWNGQVMVLMMISVAACEAGIGLALILMLFRHSGNLDITYWQLMREDNLKPFVDRDIPDSDESERHDWPQLTPAGREPQHDPNEEWHRTNV